MHRDAVSRRYNLRSNKFEMGRLTQIVETALLVRLEEEKKRSGRRKGKVKEGRNEKKKARTYDTT